MERIKPKKTLAEETYDILLDAICSGEFSPGERITQDEIALRLNVSRQPVNSAISVLKSNRLVSDTGRRGVVVAPLDPTLFAAIYEYRRAIEPFAVRLAAERMGAEARAEATELLRQGRVALEAEDPSALVFADMSFHEMLYRWSGNEVVASSMRLNWHHLRRAMSEILKIPGTPKTSWEEHARVIDALLSNDVEAAASAMEQHILTAENKIGTALAPGK